MRGLGRGRLANPSVRARVDPTSRPTQLASTSSQRPFSTAKCKYHIKYVQRSTGENSRQAKIGFARVSENPTPSFLLDVGVTSSQRRSHMYDTWYAYLLPTCPTI